MDPHHRLLDGSFWVLADGPYTLTNLWDEVRRQAIAGPLQAPQVSTTADRAISMSEVNSSSAPPHPTEP